MVRPLVGLFSEPNCLAVSLVENLLANFCRVEIVSRDKKTWQGKLEHLQSRGLVSISAPKGIGKEAFDYALFLNFPPDAALNYSRQNKIKTLVIFPYQDLRTIDRRYQIPDTVGIIFVGNLFGPRMDFVKDDALGNYILALLNKERVPYPQDKDLHPVFIGDVAKQITKWLFSFGPFGKETTLLSGPTNFDKVLKETVSWFASHPQAVGIRAKPKKGKSKLALILGVFVLLLSPYLFLLFSGAVLAFAKEGYKKRNLATTKNLLSVAEVSSSVAFGESQLASRIPLLGKVYHPGLFLAKVLRDTSGAGLKVVNLAEKAFGLAGKIVGAKPFDIVSLAGEIEVEIGSVYEDILFLEGEIKTTKGLWASYDFGDIKRYLPQAKTFATELTDVLGGQKKKVYLILLQNNMELRPTGGFIGSFALITLDSGRISEITVQDVYSADGQLKGHIEPPLAIKKYLKEANWYLRDSNWDPDFPTSAARAEWFLDKEIDVSVDGVVAVDLEVVKDLLKIAGPIVLPDFGIELEADNFYEKTQVEVEKDFFPGSYRKSGFLTALTKALLERFTASLANSSWPILEAIFDNLEKRHLQIFLHNPKAQKAVANLNWDGAVNIAACLNNCWADWFGLIEANVGVNKANYYIERNFSLDVNLGENGEIEKSLAITYKNSANQALGPQAIYKVFTRVLIPLESSVKKMSLSSGSTTEELPSETEFISARQEVGSYFEVSPGQTRTLLIQWTGKTNLDFTRPGEYRLFWRKQAGIGESPAFVNFDFPAELKYQLKLDKALTKGLTSGYNGQLARDIVSRVFWRTPE